MKKYSLRRKLKPTKDIEGGTIVNYEDAVEIDATIWQASGKLQLEMYGERLPYIKNMEYEGAETMEETDGICVDVPGDQDPDYKIISLNKDSKPWRIELEKM